MADSASQDPVYRCLDLVIDTRSCSVSRDGNPVKLPAQSYRVLVQLLQRAPHWVSSQTLQDEVWPDSKVTQETVKQQVNVLRRALDDTSTDARYIRTSVGRGFCVVPQVELVHGQRPQSARSWLTPRLRRRLQIAASVVAMAAFAWVAAPDRTPSAPPQPKPAQLFADFDPATELATSRPALHEIYRQAVELIRRDEPQHIERALGLLERVVQEAPESAGALAAAAYAMAALSAVQWGAGAEPGDRAHAYAQAALAMDPDQSPALVALAILEMEQGQFDTAAGLLQHAVAAQPDSSTVLRWRADLAHRRGQPLEALALLQQSSAASVGIDVELAHYQWELGFKDPARQRWRELAARRPQWWLPQYHLSVDELLSGELVSAMSRMQAMIERHPGCQACLRQAGIVALRRTDRTLARDLLTRALEINARDNRARTSLGLLELVDGNPGKARALFDQAATQARRALDRGSADWIHPWVLAGLAAIDGDDVWAERWLRRALAAGRLGVEWDRAEPLFAVVSDRPWFEDIMQQMEQNRSVQRRRAASRGFLSGSGDQESSG